MRFATLAFLFDEAYKNIKRNGLMSIAAITTVTITMAILGGVDYSLYRVYQVASTLPSKFEIQVFLKTSATRNQTLALKNTIQRMPGVKTVSLFTKETAWAEMQQEDKERRTFLTGDVPGNPLPDRLDIKMTRPQDIHPMCLALRDSARFPWIDTVKEDNETLNRMMATTRLIANLGIVIGLLLLTASAFVIQNTIRLTVYARRREIRIMQLVGATSRFIRFPLILEGFFYGCLGSLLASGIVLFAAEQFSNYVRAFQTPISENLPQGINPFVFVLGMMVVGMLIGSFGVFLSIRRFLKRV